MVKQNFRNQRGLSPFFGPPKIFNYAKFGFFCCTRCGRLCAELGTKILNWIGPDNDNFMHYAWPRGPGNTDIWTRHHGPRTRTKDQGPRPQFERQRQPLSHWSIQKLDNFVHRPPATNMRLPCSGANEWTPRISGSGLGSGAPRKPLPPEPTKRASLCSSFIFSLRGHPPGVDRGVRGDDGRLMALCGANFHKNVPNISLYIEHGACNPLRSAPPRLSRPILWHVCRRCRWRLDGPAASISTPFHHFSRANHRANARQRAFPFTQSYITMQNIW